MKSLHMKSCQTEERKRTGRLPNTPSGLFLIGKISAIVMLSLILIGFTPSNLRVDGADGFITSDGADEFAPKQTSVRTFSGHTDPVVIQTRRANAWSTIAYFDLTDEGDIPPDAVVTKITLTGDSSGGFAAPRRAIVDEEGERVYVNSFSNETTEHNGKPVRQRWAVQFWTSSIWDGPAMLRPIVNIHYKYELPL